MNNPLILNQETNIPISGAEPNKRYLEAYNYAISIFSDPTNEIGVQKRVDGIKLKDEDGYWGDDYHIELETSRNVTLLTEQEKSILITILFLNNIKCLSDEAYSNLVYGITFKDWQGGNCYAWCLPGNYEPQKAYRGPSYSSTITKAYETIREIEQNISSNQLSEVLNKILPIR